MNAPHVFKRARDFPRARAPGTKAGRPPGSKPASEQRLVQSRAFRRQADRCHRTRRKAAFTPQARCRDGGARDEAPGPIAPSTGQATTAPSGTPSRERHRPLGQVHLARSTWPAASARTPTSCSSSVGVRPPPRLVQCRSRAPRQPSDKAAHPLLGVQLIAMGPSLPRRDCEAPTPQVLRSLASRPPAPAAVCPCPGARVYCRAHGHYCASR